MSGKRKRPKMEAAMVVDSAPSSNQKRKSKTSHGTSTYNQTGLMKKLPQSSHETHTLDVTLDQGPFDLYTGASQHMVVKNFFTDTVPIEEGTAPHKRIGRNVVLKRLSMRFMFFAGSTPPKNGFIRILILADFQANGEALDLTKILQKSDGTSPATKFFDFRNMTVSNRYKTVVDEIYPMRELYDGDRFEMFKEYHLNLNLPLTYKTGLGTYDNLLVNNLRAFFITYDNTLTAAGQAALEIRGTARFRFSDNN